MFYFLSVFFVISVVRLLSLPAEIEFQMVDQRIGDLKDRPVIGRDRIDVVGGGGWNQIVYFWPAAVTVTRN